MFLNQSLALVRNIVGKLHRFIWNNGTQAKLWRLAHVHEFETFRQRNKITCVIFICQSKMKGNGVLKQNDRFCMQIQTFSLANLFVFILICNDSTFHSWKKTFNYSKYYLMIFVLLIYLWCRGVAAEQEMTDGNIKCEEIILLKTYHVYEITAIHTPRIWEYRWTVQVDVVT